MYKEAKSRLWQILLGKTGFFNASRKRRDGEGYLHIKKVLREIKQLQPTSLISILMQTKYGKENCRIIEKI